MSIFLIYKITKHNQGYLSTILPYKPVEYILYDKVALSHYDQKSDMSPSEQRELLHVVPLDQTQHEPYEAHDV